MADDIVIPVEIAKDVLTLLEKAAKRSHPDWHNSPYGRLYSILYQEIGVKQQRLQRRHKGGGGRPVTQRDVKKRF